MKFHRIKKEFIRLIPSDLDICLMGLQGSRMLGLAQTDDSHYFPPAPKTGSRFRPLASLHWSLATAPHTIH